MKLFNLAMILMALGVLLVAPFAVAAPSGASITTGTQERAPDQSPNTIPSEGGNVTQVNVSGYVVTTKWAGFYGEVSGDIRLADSSNHIFYQWTVSDPADAVVYACNDTVSDWSASNIIPIYAENASTGWLPAFLIDGTDSFNVTFASQEQFKSNSLTIDNVNYTTTWQGGSKGSDFKTYALASYTDKTLIWAGKAVADKTAFNSGTADYQILAGVNSQSGTTTFYFYLELP